jgi:hypothetical protein
MIGLPAFNGNATCPKCGGSNISALHMPVGKKCMGETLVAGGWRRSEVERIVRNCRRCSFDWDEAPISPAQPQKETM